MDEPIDIEQFSEIRCVGQYRYGVSVATAR